MRRSLLVTALAVVGATLGTGVARASGVCWSESPHAVLAAHGCVVDRKVTEQSGVTTDNRVVVQALLALDGDAAGAPALTGAGGANATVRQDENRFPGSVYRQSGLALSHWYASSGPARYASATASLWQTSHTANDSRRTYASAGTTAITDDGASGAGVFAEQSRSSSVACHERVAVHADVTGHSESHQITVAGCPIEPPEAPDIPLP